MSTIPSPTVQSPSHGPLPIIIGVTGHRDLINDAEQTKKLEVEVAKILDRLIKRCPKTPLVLLSPLAEGADRLVARVALSRKATLIVPLPMPADEYKKDFRDDASRQEFQDLLGRAQHSYVVPSAYNTDSPLKGHAENRSLAYAHVGAVIARECQILIALWDGMAGTEGGTEAVVNFKLYGVPRAFDRSRNVLDQAECGVVHQIVTPRQSNPRPMNPFQRIDTYPGISPAHQQAAKKGCWRIFGRIEKFNRNVIDLDPQLKQERECSKQELFKTIKPDALSPRLRAYAEAFAVASSMAIYFQRRTYWTLMVLFALGFVAAFAFNVTYRLPLHSWASFVYAVALGLAFVPLVWGWRNDYQKQYLDCRALAEGLRVQLFWSLAGLEPVAANGYLRLQRTELEWIRDALRNWTFLCELRDPTDGVEAKMDNHARLCLVLDCWVTAQAKWFKRKKTFSSARARLFVVAGWTFMVLAFLWAVVRSAASFLNVDLIGLLVELLGQDPAILEGWTRVFLELFLIGVGPAIAGLCFGFAKVTALSENAKRYDQAHIIFSLAMQASVQWLGNQLLNEDSHQRECLELLRELGKEALIENGTWLILLRDRPLAIP